MGIFIFNLKNKFRDQDFLYKFIIANLSLLVSILLLIIGLTILTGGFGCGLYKSCSNNVSNQLINAGGVITGLSTFFLLSCGTYLMIVTCFCYKKRQVNVEVL